MVDKREFSAFGAAGNKVKDGIQRRGRQLVAPFKKDVDNKIKET